MEALIGSAVAVVGTLLGSIVTFVFQRNALARQESTSRAERHRAERLAAYTDFAAAATDLRRVSFDRLHRQREDPEGAAAVTARDDYYRRLSAARQAVLKLRLLSADPELAELAQKAVEAARIDDKSSPTDAVKAGREARAALDAFIEAAAGQLR